MFTSCTVEDADAKYSLAPCGKYDAKPKLVYCSKAGQQSIFEKPTIAVMI